LSRYSNSDRHCNQCIVPEPPPTGALFAIPYAIHRTTPEADALRCHTIIEHLVAHPMWFASGKSEDEIRADVIYYLGNNEYWKYEVWLGGRFVGMILLSNVHPRIDGLLHFTFWGVTLFSARRLLWNMIGQIFRDFQLQRISFEAPEHVKGLIAFMRSRLYFKYEGEVAAGAHPLTAFLRSKDSGRFHAQDAPTWIAKQGSRREGAHWDGRVWRDVICLRLKRSEWEAKCAEVPAGEAGATAESEVSPDVAERIASQIPDLRSA
jgi:RimJ/RimL family protein N-acetyltransferase